MGVGIAHEKIRNYRQLAKILHVVVMDEKCREGCAAVTLRARHPAQVTSVNLTTRIIISISVVFLNIGLLLPSNFRNPMQDKKK